MLNRKANRIYTILAMTLLLSSLLLVRLNLPISAQEEDNLMYLHGPPTTPIHMHNSEPLVPIHLNSNMTLTPIHMHYVGPYPGEFPIYEPLGTPWHELYPEFCQNWLLTSWEDNDQNSMLSPNDQIDMTDEFEEVTWFHVDRITWTLFLTPEAGGDPMFIEFKGPPEQDPITAPRGTFWHEVYPLYCNVYWIFDWLDNGNHVLDFCDYIQLNDGTVWHVEEIVIDLILREKIMDPICTIWHEIYPNYCEWWHITSWEDNGDLRLSPSDQIDMSNNLLPLEEKWDLFWSMGDVNRDGYIDQTDLNLIEAAYGWEGPPGSIPEDINSDGYVDMLDVTICVNNQGLDYWTYFGITWYHVDRVTIALNVTLETDPNQWMKIEMKTQYFEEMYNALKHPVDTLWHEVYPDYSNIFLLTGWDWMVDDNCNGVLDYCDYIWLLNTKTQEELRYHIENVCYDVILNKKIMDPLDTGWHELYPDYCNDHTVTSWEERLDDPYPGRLSPNDQIDMYDHTSGLTRWYHVDRVTLTMYLTINATGEPYYFEWKGPFEDLYVPKTAPRGTLWTMIWPYYLGESGLVIEDWIDNCNGILDYCDYILLSGVWCHVEELAIDIILNEKITDPTGIIWHELYPTFCIDHDPIGWTDNGDGILSPSDWIEFPVLGNTHVERVTLTLYVTPEIQGVPMYIELEADFPYIYDFKTQPIGSIWHEVYPEFCLLWVIEDWMDNCNGVLDYCDYIWMMDPTGYPQWWHVEELSIDIVVDVPVHDVAVIDVYSIYDWVYQGEIDPIKVTVENQGDFTETVDVTAYYIYPGAPAAPMQQVTLIPGETRILTFNWDTTGVPTGFYTVSAEAVISIDNDLSDNYMQGNVEEVRQRPPWYKKPPYPDYAPSGMPDFDQKQDGWFHPMWGWTWCGPVAVANSLWWFDSKYESINNPAPVPPPAISDSFRLVTAYGAWDDHDPRNLDPLVQNLAFLMDTDGRRTGLPHSGTNYIDMETGISQYLQQQGINPVGDCDGDGDVDNDDITIINNAMGTVPGAPGWDMRADIVINNVIDIADFVAASGNLGLTGMFYEKTVDYPDFYWIEEEVERCEDVVLLLSFWQEIDIGIWEPVLYPGDLPGGEGGHYVTVAGVNSTNRELLLADPWWNAAEAGWPGDVPVPHGPYPCPVSLHNDTLFVSHDAYGTVFWPPSPPAMPPSPYPTSPVWELAGYLQQIGWPANFHAFIRAAVVTSPLAEQDVAVIDVHHMKTNCTPAEAVCAGMLMDVYVTVENQGGSTETFNVTAWANATKIGEQTTTLNAGANTTLTFTWNTTGLTEYDVYEFRGTAEILPSETDVADNVFVDGTVLITHMGDITGDHKVDIQDLARVSGAFGSVRVNNPSDPKYGEYWHPTPCAFCPHQPNTDVNGDGKVDIQDVARTSANFGWH